MWHEGVVQYVVLVTSNVAIVDPKDMHQLRKYNIPTSKVIVISTFIKKKFWQIICNII